jgi:uncharacterized protein (UPF0212 family)
VEVEEQKMITKKQVEITIEIRKCPVCGVYYGLDKDYYDKKYENNGSWYCPNGHSIVFTKSQPDVLKQQVKDLENRLAAQKAHTESIKRSRSAIKGQLTKAKKRIGAGVCPCCNRQFSNLREHMGHMHPEYKDGEVEE